jgi:hypothetical protein
MTLWQRLYIAAADPADPDPARTDSSAASGTSLHHQLLQQLPTHLETLGFKAYDPFGLMPSTRAYAQTVKLFVAPADDQTRWLQLIPAPDSALPDDLLRTLSQQNRLILHVILEDESTAQFIVYRDGERSSSWRDELRPYYVDSAARPQSPSSGSKSSASSTIPTDGMPENLRAMTDQLGGLQNRQVQNMMNRMTNKLLNADQQQKGQNLLRGSQIDWSRSGGQQIAQVLSSLGIPDWQSPDYTALRDAYQLQRRLQRNPNARLYPGDQDAIDAVPDALRYTPIFAGIAGT